MDAPHEDRMEGRLREIAAGMDYPPTPDVAGGVARGLGAAAGRRRLRLAWVLAAFLLAMGLLAAPPVRAQLAEFIQIGAVRILLGVPTPTPTPTLQPTRTVAPLASATPLPTATPTRIPPSGWLKTLTDLAGEVTLEEAADQVGFPLRLPAYPPDLDAPDHIYQMDLGGPVVVLVWMDAQDPAQPSLILQVIGPGAMQFEKWNAAQVQETQVNGTPAVWVDGPYYLEMRGGSVSLARLVEGHVLIWQEGEVTYRLETGASLEEAVRSAESLR